MATRVGKYKRRSTDEDHQPFSLDAQDTRLDAYITSQDDWTHDPACDFTDNKSGYTLDRPGLEKALTYARAGRYDLLLVAKVDRLSRSIRGLTNILDDLDAAGVAFRSATEPFDTATPAGRMMVQMLGVFAEFERRMIIDRVIAGMERKATRGEWTSGSHPFGYTTNSETGFLVPLTSQAPLVPVIFDLYANKGMGSRNIATWLNQRGYRTRQGHPWSFSAVLTILRNRAYLGEIYFRGHYYQAPHPPLIDQHLFERVQAMLAERGEDLAVRAANASDYLATGKLRCGRCNKRYIGMTANGNRYPYRYYVCNTRQRHGPSTCPADRLPAEELDRALLNALLITVQRSDLIERASANLAARLHTNQDHYQARLTTIEQELRRTDQAIDRYMLAFEGGKLEADRFGTRVHELALTSSNLQRERDELLTAIHQADGRPAMEPILAGLCDQVRHVIAIKESPPKKTLIRALVQDIEVRSRKEIYPTFRIPTTPDLDARAKVRMPIGLVGLAGLEPAT